MVSENRTKQAEQGDAPRILQTDQGQYLRGFPVETSVRPKNLDLGSLEAGLQLTLPLNLCVCSAGQTLPNNCLNEGCKRL